MTPRDRALLADVARLARDDGARAALLSRLASALPGHPELQRALAEWARRSAQEGAAVAEICEKAAARGGR